MEKINFENLPSTNTPINATNLNQMQDNVENAINGKSVITAGINSNFTVTTTGAYIVPINKEIANKGNAFKIENGKIIINDDISYVKVSGNIAFRCIAGSGAALNFLINKNGTNVGTSMSTISATTESNQARTISPILLEVSKGDYFEIQVYARANEYIMGSSERTNITIEEV